VQSAAPWRGKWPLRELDHRSACTPLAVRRWVRKHLWKDFDARAMDARASLIDDMAGACDAQFYEVIRASTPNAPLAWSLHLSE